MPEQWDPIRDLMVLQDRMNQLFADATERRTRAGGKPADAIDEADWMPAADIYEEPERYLLAVDLPGVDRSALEIDVENSHLTIRGMRVVQAQTEHRRERPQGRFVRTFGVPPSVDQEQIAAEYKDGVLYVRLAKRKSQKTQRVEIKVS